MFNDKLVHGIRSALQKEPQVLAGYVLGSFVTDKGDKAQDFDLAVVVDNKRVTTTDRVYNLIAHVHFPRDLDLSVVDKGSSPLFLFQMISKGKRIYERSGRDAASFEAHVLRIYYDTAHIRNIYNSYLPKKFAGGPIASR